MRNPLPVQRGCPLPCSSAEAFDPRPSDRTARLPLAGIALAGLTVIASEMVRAQDEPPSALPQLGSEETTQPQARNSRWYLQTSAYTYHYSDDPDLNNYQWLLNLEWQSPKWLLGGAFFYNSFGQPSQYLYGGMLWRPLNSGFYLKLTSGLLHGYKGEYQDNIPLNDLGVAPALIPAIGYSGKRFATELIPFAAAGIMWTVGVLF